MATLANDLKPGLLPESAIHRLSKLLAGNLAHPCISCIPSGYSIFVAYFLWATVLEHGQDSALHSRLKSEANHPNARKNHNRNRKQRHGSWDHRKHSLFSEIAYEECQKFPTEASGIRWWNTDFSQKKGAQNVLLAIILHTIHANHQACVWSTRITTRWWNDIL